MGYTPLRNVRSYVVNRQEFKGNNIFARHYGPLYAVFSYRHDWPLFIHGAGMWFENKDKFSRSTSRHHTAAHPLSHNTRKLSVHEMNDLLNPHTQAGSVLRMLATAEETSHDNP